MVKKFLNYKMVDSNPLMEQVEELQLLIHEVLAEGMKICETFQVACIIEKLPPSWEAFRARLTHKKKDMKVEELIVRLRVESTNVQSAKATSGAGPSQQKVNLAEHNKKRKFQPQSSNSKPTVKKFAGKCHNCGKMGHKADVSRSKKTDKKGKSQTNLVEDDLCCVVSETNMIGCNPREWHYDSGATRHICSERGMFQTYQASTNQKVYMENSSTSEVAGTGKVILRLTSGKDLTLNNVLHVPDIRRNLLSGILLNRHGFEVNFKSDKLVLSKNGVYLGKGYIKDELIKMNVIAVPSKTDVTASTSMNKNESIAYVVESFNVWHEQLGHVNYKSISRSINMNMIPKCK